MVRRTQGTEGLTPATSAGWILTSTEVVKAVVEASVVPLALHRIPRAVAGEGAGRLPRSLDRGADRQSAGLTAIGVGCLAGAGTVSGLAEVDVGPVLKTKFEELTGRPGHGLDAPGWTVAEAAGAGRQGPPGWSGPATSAWDRNKRYLHLVMRIYYPSGAAINTSFLIKGP